MKLFEVLGPLGDVVAADGALKQTVKPVGEAVQHVVRVDTRVAATEHRLLKGTSF